MYLFDGQRLDVDDPRFDATVAEAHARHRRPVCLCKPAGVPMYVARFGDEYLIKRMPYSGTQHAPACPSYDLPSNVSEQEHAADAAVFENPETGLTTIRIGFALSRWGGRSIERTQSDQSDSVSRASPDISPVCRFMRD